MNYETSMLVGYTGFVGSNLDGSHSFTYRINSKNPNEAEGKSPDLLIFAGLRAEKYLANKAPEKDYEEMKRAFSQIKAIDAKKVVLISTVDVYKTPVNVDENSEIDTNGLNAYGLNRYRLEKMLREEYPDALIVRLPGLFGKGLKKNFIYDHIHVIPSMLKAEKYEELASKSNIIEKSYELLDNGFYGCTDKENALLKEEFKKVGFTALNFTDSRGVFQFYSLSRLYDDIMTALDHDIKLLNIATEPVSVEEVYRYVTNGKEFINEISDTPPLYDYKSVHYRLYGGRDGYFYDKSRVLEEIKEFVDSQI